MGWLWAALVVALVAMLAGFAVTLLRRLVRLAAAVADLLGRTAILAGVRAPEREARPVPAVLGDPEALRAAWRHRRWLARERRILRARARVARATAIVRAGRESGPGLT